MPMRRIVPLLGLGLLVSAGFGLARAAETTGSTHARHSGTAATHSAGAAGNQDKLMHALGVLISRQSQLGLFQLSDHELHEVLAGIADGLHDPGAVKEAQNYIPQLSALAKARAEQQSQQQQRIGAAYLAKAAALPNARKTASGLVFIPQQEGTGAMPRIGDQVRVQYTGRLTDGSVFDSSAQHGGSATFPLGHVIPCWNEALQLMKVGGSARIVCPANLAYGDRGAGGIIEPGATLDFDVHVLGIEPPAPAGAPTPGAAGAGAPPAGH